MGSRTTRWRRSYFDPATARITMGPRIWVRSWPVDRRTSDTATMLTPSRESRTSTACCAKRARHLDTLSPGQSTTHQAWQLAGFGPIPGDAHAGDLTTNVFTIPPGQHQEFAMIEYADGQTGADRPSRVQERQPCYPCRRVWNGNAPKPEYAWRGRNITGDFSLRAQVNYLWAYWPGHVIRPTFARLTRQSAAGAADDAAIQSAAAECAGAALHRALQRRRCARSRPAIRTAFRRRGQWSASSSRSAQVALAVGEELHDAV